MIIHAKEKVKIKVASLKLAGTLIEIDTQLQKALVMYRAENGEPISVWTGIAGLEPDPGQDPALDPFAGGGDVRSHNVGKSDYSKHAIQPWDIWIEYGLNPWDADIVKRVLRTKDGDSRATDYEKIIHICQERLRQLKGEGARWEDNLKLFK